jgi:hypothetical protein
MRVKLEKVPLEIRRRAARHLEAIRGTQMSAGNDAAQLGEEACPVYRPDVKGVAYWELEVTGVKATSRNGGGQNGGRKATGNGFLILSAGRHDVPIPHWSFELEPPSRELEAQSADKQVARVVKLDSLAYVAEDAKGTYLSHIGQFPPMPTGLPTSLPPKRKLSSLQTHPTTATKTDKRVVKQAVETTGARLPKPKVLAWKSWGQAKKQYASAYRLHLGALKEHAAPSWQIEDLVAKFGEGIHEGDRLVVPLLLPGKAQLAGDGVKSVKMRMLDRKPPAVELLAGGAEQKQEQQFQLRLSYRDGTSETLTFFVIPKGTPSNRRRVLPHPVPVLPPR